MSARPLCPVAPLSFEVDHSAHEGTSSDSPTYLGVHTLSQGPPPRQNRPRTSTYPQTVPPTCHTPLPSSLHSPKLIPTTPSSYHSLESRILSPHRFYSSRDHDVPALKMRLPLPPTTVLGLIPSRLRKPYESRPRVLSLPRSAVPTTTYGRHTSGGSLSHMSLSWGDF